MYSEQYYLATAMQNLRITSRTANGSLDVASSENKRDQLLNNIADLDQVVLRNYLSTIQHLLIHRSVLLSNEKLFSFILDVADLVNRNIVISPASFREGIDSTRFSYTKIAQLPTTYRQFVDELSYRLRTIPDPIALAAWIEWRVDCTDHFFADGCGRIAKALAAWVLMIYNCPLPQYELAGSDIRTAYYQVNLHIVQGRFRGDDPSFDDHALAVWTYAYRRYFTESAHDCVDPESS